MDEHPCCSTNNNANTNDHLNVNEINYATQINYPLAHQQKHKCSNHHRLPHCNISLLLLILLLINTAQCATITTWTRSLFAADSPTVDDGRPFSCARTTYLYNTLARTKQFTRSVDAASIPIAAIASVTGQICPITQTCCTVAMETNLKNDSEKQFHRNVQDKVIGIRHLLETHARNFDQSMRSLLDESSRDLHSMFSLTYGEFFTQHTALFQQLFSNITAFYNEGHPSVATTLHTFYSELFVRMFTLLNPQYTLTPRYITCMHGAVNELQPFGPAPAKMQAQLGRSMIAARTFSQSLIAARDAVRAVMEVVPSSPCKLALMRMTYCAHCGGETTSRPCTNYCLNVIKGCLAEQSDLDQDWTSLIDALLSLLDMLRGVFNVENVISPIDLHISSAIMQFQEKAFDISNKIVTLCGRPPTVTFWRHRRNTNSTDSLHALRYGATQDSGPQKQNGGKMTKVMETIAKELAPTRGFWRKLPYALCADMQHSGADTGCWNGSHAQNYNRQLVGDGLANQVNNPEVPLEPRPNPQISAQMLKMRMTSERLKEAQNMRAVIGNDQSETTIVASASAHNDAARSSMFALNSGKVEVRAQTTRSPPRLFMPEGSGSDTREYNVEGSGSESDLDSSPVIVPHGAQTDDEDVHAGWMDTVVEGSGEPLRPTGQQNGKGISDATWHLSGDSRIRPNQQQWQIEGSGDPIHRDEQTVIVEPPPTTATHSVAQSTTTSQIPIAVNPMKEATTTAKPGLANNNLSHLSVIICSLICLLLAK